MIPGTRIFPDLGIQYSNSDLRSKLAGSMVPPLDSRRLHVDHALGEPGAVLVAAHIQARVRRALHFHRGAMLRHVHALAPGRAGEGGGRYVVLVTDEHTTPHGPALT